MPSLLLLASFASIVIFIIIAIFIHHGITHPEDEDFFSRWFDTTDFMKNFNNLGKSHGGVVLALSIFLAGLIL